MALSGAFLVLFVTFHALMNGVAIFWPTGYNMVCEFLGANWYALVGSLVLGAVVILHIVYAIWLTLQNRAARGHDDRRGRSADRDRPAASGTAGTTNGRSGASARPASSAGRSASAGHPAGPCLPCRHACPPQPWRRRGPCRRGDRACPRPAACRPPACAERTSCRSKPRQSSSKIQMPC